MNINPEVNTTEESIGSYFDEAMGKLIEVIASFKDDDFNKVPFEGSWTAGQVSEHLYKSVSGISGLLLTETKAADRDAFEKCEVIASTFLNFEVKFKSPDFIQPSNEPKQVSFFVDAFKKTAKEINDAMKQVDLSRVYTRFPLPQLGELTGWEWIYFSAAHSVRHTRQMKKIHEKLQR